MRNQIQRKSSRKIRALILGAAVGAVAIPLAHRAKAASNAWNNTVGGNWNTSGNWTGAVPVGGQDVFITNSFVGSQTISYNYGGAAVTLNSFTLNATNGGTNVLTMAANNLTVGGAENIGLGSVLLGTGSAVFNQSGGTHTVNGQLFIAGGISTVTYDLSGSAILNVTNGYEAVGYGGTGLFNQSGGTNIITGGVGLLIGENVGATGNYTLSSGTLTAQVGGASGGTEYIGHSGTGNFNQNGGANTVPSLYVGASNTATGSYLLSAGNVNITNVVYVGFSGLATFNQTGGTNSLTGFGAIRVGYNAGATGTYTLGNGALISENNIEFIGDSGVGTFNQTGGTNAITNSGALIVGNNALATGSYTLGSGSLSAPLEFVAFNAMGTFNQTGGSNNLGTTGGFLVAEDPAAVGTYSLGPGTLTAGLESVAIFGKGTFLQSDGTNNFATSLDIGISNGATGSYALSGGSAGNGNEIVGDSGFGSFNQSGGSNSFSNLIVGNTNSGSGSYSLAGGAMTTSGGEFIGASANGTFNQAGGVNTLLTNAPLVIGDFAAATGAYTLGAGALLSVNEWEFIGDHGLGTFNQSGGINALTTNSVLIVGGYTTPGGSGTYTLGGGTLSSGFEWVGNTGTGNFNQNGGTNAVAANGELIVGNSSGATGSYTLNGGSLSAPLESIGENGLGSFVQTGGTNTLTSNGNLYLGTSNGASGSYTLSNGYLNAAGGVEYVGYLGVGNFNQSGGSNSLLGLFLASTAGVSASFTLSAGTMTAGGQEYIGISGPANFNQSGGTNAMSGFGGLDIAFNSNCSATYTLSGGSVSVQGGYEEIIADQGTGNFFQSGGTNTLTGGSPMVIANNTGSTGTYALSGGLISAITESVGGSGSARFNQSGGTNAASVAITLNHGALYTMSGGAINTPAEKIGNTSNAIFNQSGGTNSLTSGGNLSIAVGASSSSTYTLSGGMLKVGGTAFVGGSAVAGGIGNLLVSGTGQFTASTLFVYQHGFAKLGGAPATVNNLVINSGGLVDMASGSLTINYGVGSPNSTIRNYISSGYNAASAILWSGTTGMTSSTAAADPSHHSVAFADGADGIVVNLPANVSTAIPAGGTLPTGVELVTYAYAGDANLDSKVDFSDFIVLSNHFGNSDINWDHGNFNYDSKVDFADFIVLSNNFGAGVTAANGTGATSAELAQYNALAESFGISQSQIAAWDATISNLPEPSSLGLILAGSATLLRRRRGRRC